MVAKSALVQFLQISQSIDGEVQKATHRFLRCTEHSVAQYLHFISQAPREAPQFAISALHLFGLAAI